MSNRPKFNEADLEVYKQQRLNPIHQRQSDKDAQREQLEMLQQLQHAESMTEILHLLDAYHALCQHSAIK